MGPVSQPGGCGRTGSGGRGGSGEHGGFGNRYGFFRSLGACPRRLFVMSDPPPVLTLSVYTPQYANAARRFADRGRPDLQLGPNTTDAARCECRIEVRRSPDWRSEA